MDSRINQVAIVKPLWKRWITPCRITSYS